MKIQRSMKKVGKPFFNVQKWIGTSSLMHGGAFIGSFAKSLLKVQQAERQEHFDDAIKRLGLNEQELNIRQRNYFLLSTFFLFVTAAVFVYAIYHALIGNFFAAIFTAAISLLCLSQVFRNHFWYFQIKQRRLGCTFGEWVRFVTGRKV